MLLSQWLRQIAQRWFPRGGNRRRRAARVPALVRRRVRPCLEELEDRVVPSTFPTSFSNLSNPTITYGSENSVTVSGLLQGTFGQLVPAGESVRVGIGNASQMANLDGYGNFSATFDSSATDYLNAGGSPYGISFDYGGDQNYASASASSTLTVTKATPTFSNLSAPTVSYGEDAEISGQIGADSGASVREGENVTIYLGKLTYVTPTDGNGNFYCDIDTGLLQVSVVDPIV